MNHTSEVTNRSSATSSGGRFLHSADGRPDWRQRQQLSPACRGPWHAVFYLLKDNRGPHCCKCVEPPQWTEKAGSKIRNVWLLEVSSAMPVQPMKPAKILVMGQFGGYKNALTTQRINCQRLFTAAQTLRCHCFHNIIIITVPLKKIDDAAVTERDFSGRGVDRWDCQWASFHDDVIVVTVIFVKEVNDILCWCLPCRCLPCRCNNSLFNLACLFHGASDEAPLHCPS